MADTEAFQRPGLMFTASPASSRVLDLIWSALTTAASSHLRQAWPALSFFPNYQLDHRVYMPTYTRQRVLPCGFPFLPGRDPIPGRSCLKLRINPKSGRPNGLTYTPFPIHYAATNTAYVKNDQQFRYIFAA